MKCKICQNETTSFKVAHYGEYYHCSQCEFIFKNSQHYLNSAEEFKQYELHNNSIDDPRYVAYFKDFIDKAILPFISQPKKGLDFGSGPSPVLAMILERDYGFEMDIYDLFYAQEKVYQGKTYPLIVSTEVLEHIHDPLKVFTLFKQLMLQNSLLVIMTSKHTNSQSFFENWHYIKEETHVSFFSDKTMEYIAEMFEWEIIYTDHKRYTTFKTKKWHNIN